MALTCPDTDGLPDLESVINAAQPGRRWTAADQRRSCEVAVLAGEVDHRDEVLREEERARNSAMTLCVSRALSDRLLIQL